MYKIAICDDEDALIKELKDGLQRYAAETGKEFCYFAFHDGGELLQAYQPDYDLIFMDIKMESSRFIRWRRWLRMVSLAVAPLSRLPSSSP